MKELELLGLQPDGEQLTLNDSEGNRYVLPITDALRAALRRDRQAADPSEPDRQMSPREIQAYIREGMSVDEVCELSALPASRVAALAYPIIAEREYTARVARSFSIGHDRDGLTIEELVASRLLGRGVRPDDIAWDSLRRSGEPWTLIATFVTGDREHRASWYVDLERRALQALDDEGSWLSETQFPVSSSPWRPANTPPAAFDQSDEDGEDPRRAPIEDVLATLDQQRGRARPMPAEPFEGAHPAPSQPEQAKDATVLTLPRRSTLPEGDTGRGAAAGESAPSAPPASDAEGPSDSESGVPRRGSGGPDEEEKEADGGKAAAGEPTGREPSRASRSQKGRGQKARHSQEDAPDSPSGRQPGEQDGSNLQGAHSAEAADALAGDVSLPGRRRKRRGSRPSMPSWDEIVFGKKD